MRRALWTARPLYLCLIWAARLRTVAAVFGSSCTGSGVCTVPGVCSGAGTAPGTCSANASKSCSATSDCLIPGTCALSSGATFGICQNIGFICRGDADCSGTCNLRTIRGTCSTGGSCLTDPDCTKTYGNCSPSTQTCGGVGASCTTNTDCATDYCLNGKCQNAASPVGGTYFGGLGSACSGAGKPCANTMGACLPQGQCSNSASSCKVDSDCNQYSGFGICASNGRCFLLTGSTVGDPCKSNAECPEQIIGTGTCTMLPSKCRDTGTVCQMDSDCPAHTFGNCSPSPSTCGGSGAPCSANSDCARGFCTSRNVCSADPMPNVIPGTIGSRCSQDSNCITSQLCRFPAPRTGFCNPSYAPCFNDADCASSGGGVCFGPHSGQCDNGRDCFYDSDCNIAGVTCSPTDICGGSGATCTSSSQCMTTCGSGICGLQPSGGARTRQRRNDALRARLDAYREPW